MITYFIAFFILVGEWYVFKSSIGITYPNPFGTFLKAIGDTSLFMIPFLLLNRNWRWIIVVEIFAISFFFFINCLYFRFWEDLIPTSVFASTNNFDSNLFDYAHSLIVLSDFLFIFLPVLFLIIFIFLQPNKGTKLPLKLKIGGLFLSILMFIAGQTSYLKSGWEFKHDVEKLTLKNILINHIVGDNSSYFSSYSQKGLPIYLTLYSNEWWNLKFNKKNLSDEEQRLISSFLDKNKIISEKDILLKNKNIIFIVAESLNSNVIGMKLNDFNVTPTLDSLLSENGTLFFDRVVSQTKSGGSSDGQLILLTGLLPLNHGAAAVSFPNNAYPSLPYLLNNYHSEAFLADNGVAWNQEGSLKNYGFLKVHTIKDFKESADSIGKDRALFNYFLKKLPELPKPYFVTLITMSMHVPFMEDGVQMNPVLDSIEDFDSNDKNYINAVNYFDTALKNLISHLSHDDLIIIASDHSQNIVKLNTDPFAAYIALHTDTTAYINRIVGQANLFPVTLQLTGITNNYYNGVAPSAFNNKVNSALDGTLKKYGEINSDQFDSLKNEYNYSDLIIRGNYFSSLKGIKQ